MEISNKSAIFTLLIAEVFATSPGHFSRYPDTLFFLPPLLLSFPMFFFLREQSPVESKTEEFNLYKKDLK